MVDREMSSRADDGRVGADAAPGERSGPPQRRIRPLVASACRRLQRTYLGAVVARLAQVDFVDTAVLFGAALLLSVLPLVIITSALTDNHVEVELSRHLGLTSSASRVVASLFTAPHSAPPLGLAIGMLLGVLGTIAVASSVRRIYETTFSQARRGLKELWRLIVWLAALAAVIAGEDVVGTDLRTVGDHQLVFGVVAFCAVFVFVLWTMHFLLAGTASWGHLVPSALATAICGICLEVVSALYFPSTIVSDSKLYGTIGVVFTLVSWFIAIGAVIVLGAVAGAVWEERHGDRVERGHRR